MLSACSLVDVFGTLADDFESEHDGVDVEVITGSSTELAAQAADGAPGDVLATADETSMRVAEEAGAVTASEPFATNVLVIATPPGNPAGVRSLADLAGATWVRCADEVPCGRVALAVLADHGIDAEPVSLEEDARSTLDKVATGEADAALVYRTDAITVGDAVTTIEVPGAQEHRTTYVIAPLDQAADGDLARAFVDLVNAPTGRDALDAAGFGSP